MRVQERRSYRASYKFLVMEIGFWLTMIRPGFDVLPHVNGIASYSGLQSGEHRVKVQVTASVGVPGCSDRRGTWPWSWLKGDVTWVRLRS